MGLHTMCSERDTRRLIKKRHFLILQEVPDCRRIKETYFSMSILWVCA